MKEPRWKKIPGANPGPSKQDGSEAGHRPNPPATEAELEALRYQGTPIRRRIPPLGSPPTEKRPA